jgi:hypothetical protein
MGECRLIIKHDGLVNDEVRGDRARKIREIFIETERGERFLLPHKNLHGARALAQHLSHGGDIRDDRAEHINELVQEMSAMSHFVRSTKKRQFEDQETADMTRAAVHHYDQVKRTLRQMRGARGYRSYFEAWAPEGSVEDQVDVDSLRERFVKKIYDDRFNDALPFVYRAYKKQKASAGKLGDELEEWADDVTGSVTESTWAKPDSADKITALRELLKTPMPCGIDGIDAQTKIEPIIGDDDLNDDIFDLSTNQGPDADCRPLIKQWLVQTMPDLLKELEFGKKNSQDGQTNWAQPTSPKQDNHDFGSQPTGTNVSNMTY